MEKTYNIKHGTLNDILAYLQNARYADVAGLIALIRSEIQAQSQPAKEEKEK